MKIGIDAGRALYGRGGVASYTRQLVNGLVRHAPEHDVVLFDLDYGVGRRDAYQRAFGPLPGSVRTAAVDSRDLSELDIFHAPAFAMPPPGAPRHVFTLHDLTILSHPGFHTLDNRVRTLVSIAEALTRGSAVIAVSRATRAEAVRLLSLADDTIEVLAPILDPRFTSAGTSELDEAALRKLGLDSPYCLAVGSLEPRKNFDRLLDAWEQLPERLRNLHVLVVVASAGWLEGGLRNRLKSLRKTGSVRVLANLSGADLAVLYRRAQVVLFPSLAEGFGLPVAEAMACGAPVVTSDRSSMPEVADGGAILVDPEDTDAIAGGLARVLEHEELRRDLRERGPEIAARFSAEAVVPRLLEIYRRAVSRSIR